MRSWWIGGALTVGWLSLALPLWAQAPLPEPLPVGAPPAPHADFGPLNPQLAPPGPPDSLAIPAGVWLGWRLHGTLDQRQIYRACYGLLVVTALKLLWDGVSGYLA